MDNHLKIASFLSKLLDEQFRFLGYKFGLDPIIGLVPVFGDLASVAVSVYLIWIGIKMKLPGTKIARMVWNIILDFVLGFVPILGDAADFVFKSNKLNLSILMDHVNSSTIEGETIK